MSRFTFTVNAEDSGQPVKNLVKRHFHFSSRLMTKLKYGNLISVNNDKVPGWHKCKAGDFVSVEMPEEKSKFPPEDIPIYPVYEDDDILIINKQSGVTVHPTKGHPTGTIANGLMMYMEKTGESFKIRFVNRLDMDTTGALIIAKNSNAQDSLIRQMNKNIVKKTYLAVCEGVISNNLSICLPIGRPLDGNVRRAVLHDAGQESVTHVKPVRAFTNPNATLIRIILETGRTHQIRVHLSHIGHPLLGDTLYGGSSAIFNERQALHAESLSFLHPLSNESITVHCPLPSDMLSLIASL